MLRTSQAFEDGELPVDRLSSDLKGIIAALSHIADLEWVERIRTMRNQIELINAIYLNSGRSALTPIERQEVKESLSDLREALNSKLPEA